MPVDLSAKVIANTRLSADYNALALAAPAIAGSVSSGQFVMLRVANGHDPLLRRPFSIFERLRSGDRSFAGISILNKRIGPVSRRLYDAHPGQLVECLGPLGRPFTVADRPTDAWMIAGGVGLAPFLSLAEELHDRGVHGTLFYGARTGAELFYVDRFRSLGLELVLATEDGSVGERGRITAPFERALAARDAATPLMLYACGPEGLLAACARLAGRFRHPCQVSVERVMGCGLGGCYSCVVPMRGHDGVTHHVRSCLAGPVMPAHEIVWD
jgi:dihydroorotate dehydrogenase electron transfer subunit